MYSSGIAPTIVLEELNRIANEIGNGYITMAGSSGLIVKWSQLPVYVINRSSGLYSQRIIIQRDSRRISFNIR